MLKPQAPDTLLLMCECLSLLLSPSNGHKNQNNGHSMSDLLRTGWSSRVDTPGPRWLRDSADIVWRVHSLSARWRVGVSPQRDLAGLDFPHVILVECQACWRGRFQKSGSRETVAPEGWEGVFWGVGLWRENCEMVCHVIGTDGWRPPRDGAVITCSRVCLLDTYLISTSTIIIAGLVALKCNDVCCWLFQWCCQRVVSRFLGVLRGVGVTSALLMTCPRLPHWQHKSHNEGTKFQGKR